MAQNMLLYWGTGSPPCWRLMIALEEKQLQGYKHKLLSFDKKEHQSPEVKALNPRAQLPTFKHGEIVVNESFAACLYLENVFKTQGTRLIPDDPAQMALVYQRMFETENLQQKMYEVAFYDWMVPEGERLESALKRNKEKLIEELKLWEGYLEKMGKGSYLAGKNFSMADVVCFPVVAYFPRLQCPKERCPRLMEYYEMVKDRPSIKASWPPEWLEKPVGADILKSL
ncbi:glutathione S-transferase rho [Danio aesculapii]|uniref:glutathione S-transferase rho n=1 Tax=Danio aesculapii TaxID=1142201 RepID=UPI0024BFB566|nr:glutathione S-transferase rho [Danio aesculapii]